MKMGVNDMFDRARSLDYIKMVPIFFCILIALMIAFCAFYFFVKRQDNNKEIVTRKIKVLEKPIQQGNIEWYVVECENGERLKLRSFQANNVLITVGDEGMISYKGQTIQSFQRK